MEEDVAVLVSDRVEIPEGVQVRVIWIFWATWTDRRRGCVFLESDITPRL
jgi:hypothetical protein